MLANVNQGTIVYVWIQFVIDLELFSMVEFSHVLTQGVQKMEEIINNNQCVWSDS